MPEHTAKNLVNWEEIRDKVAPRIAALVEKIRENIPNDKSLARFGTTRPLRRRFSPKIAALAKRVPDEIPDDKSLAQFGTTRPLPRQFYEILEVRANAWVSEVHRICRDARNNPNGFETKDFKQAVFDFVIEPFIDEQLPDLLLRAAGFKNMERQLVIRGEREVKAYMPERYASLMVTAFGCHRIRDQVRSRWMGNTHGLTAGGVVAETKVSDIEENRKGSLTRTTSKDPNKSARLELGRWADMRLEEARIFARLARGGRSPDDLRKEFPTLFADVIDRLPGPSRERLLEAAQRQLMTVPDLMEWIADVKQLKGATLSDYRLEYRSETGTGRKRRQREKRNVADEAT